MATSQEVPTEYDSAYYQLTRSYQGNLRSILVRLLPQSEKRRVTGADPIRKFSQIALGTAKPPRSFLTMPRIDR